MDTSNWRATQGAVVDPSMDSGDWRTQLQADSRQRIVNKIMEILKRHLPFSGNEGLHELQKIAERFEEKIYTSATSQSDYLRKISLKMLTMENRSQNPVPDAMQSNSAANSVNPSDPGSGSQVIRQGQQLPISVSSGNIQSGQQMMSQSMHSNIGSTGMQGSSSLPSAMPPGSGLQHSTMANVAGQNSNMQNIQNMSGVQQNTVGNTMGAGNFANQRQQIQGRQQLAPQQQQLQQPQNSHYLYHQQLQQLAKQKHQQPSMQSHIQQQQQQNLLQPGHLQPSQQSAMQPTMMETSSLSSVVQTQQPVVPQSSQPLINHQQSVLRQRQQQVQPIQQNSMGQQPNATNMQQNQLIGQQNNYSDVQQQQRLIGQQNKLSSVQQPQQQLIGQHNNLSSMQQHQSGQQHQLLGSQSGNSNMQANQHSVQQMMQSSMTMQQQNHHSSATLLPTQVQQSLTQLQQQVTPHMQSQPGQLQQQVGMQQQPNLLQRDMQQRLPASGVFQQQNMIDQQKQLFQQQRAMPEASSTSLDSTAQTSNPNGGDWQEEAYQKLKAMKDLYLLDLNDMYQKILGKLQHCDSLPQPPKNEQLEKLKVFKSLLERYIQFLQIPKHAIVPNFKDKLSAYENHITQVINSHRRKPVGQQQQAQALPPAHMQSMQQSHQTHSQLTQVQSHETQMNLQGSMAPMQPNNIGNLQQSTVPSLSGGSNVQQNMMNSVQPSSNLEPGQNSSMNSLQQNTVSGSQQVNINPMSLQANSNMLQHQHIKQEQLLQSQQLKQFQHPQMQQHYLQKQQLMQQQLNQQTKQQQPTGQMQGNQLSQLHQINDGGDIKLRQQMSVRSGAYQQHHAAAGQRSAYHQQLKSGPPFSPQLLSSASPQMSQHASPQIDQSNMLKSANSPFTVPSPSTSSASPIPGELINGLPSLSNAGNIGHQQPSSAVLPTRSLAIGTPGLSASLLLAEFASPEGNHGTAVSIGSGKSVTEQPLERLLKVVQSMSPKALSASVGDIGSVVSMIDRIAGSAPGNGSRAAVGEDLVAMTKCRLQARNFVTQDGTNGTRKMKRFTSAIPLNVVSSAGSVNDSYLDASETSELDSTASSSIKRPRTESNHALLEEIKEINRGLIDTVVSISEEDIDPAAASAVSEGGDGTLITCSFSAVALGPNLKSQYASAQMSPIQPLRLLVPANYPNCSPILLDKFPAEISKEFEDISTKTKSRFSISLRSLSQPMSLKEIARTWDACAAAVMSEYAQRRGGGTFSSKYGTWENCLSAA